MATTYEPIDAAATYDDKQEYAINARVWFGSTGSRTLAGAIENCRSRYGADASMLILAHHTVPVARLNQDGTVTLAKLDMMYVDGKAWAVRSSLQDAK